MELLSAIEDLEIISHMDHQYLITYVTRPAKIDHVSANYSELYFC